MSAIVQVTSSDFILQSLSTIGGSIPDSKKGYILLIKSYRCRYCVEYYPAYEQFALQNPSIGFLVLEASLEGELVQQWGELASPAYSVDGYPTVVAYDSNGHPLKVIEDRHHLDVEMKALF